MGPIEGTRVLDLSRYGPGRYCSMILADFGAEVITVETPRGASQLHALMTDDAGPRYLGQNRNKKSIALNLKKEGGRQAVYRLAETVDVIIETYRPGVVKRLGVDYETIRKINPRVVYCSITSWGQDSPYAQRAGHDLNFTALAGITGLVGPKGSPPMELPFQIGDLAGGTSQATIAILAALLARERTGQGQFIDVSMTDGVIFYLWTHAMMFFQSGHSPERSDLPTGSDMAWMNIYQARDGKYFTVGCFEAWLWENLCKLVGREDFIEHHWGAKEKQIEMYHELSKVFLTKDRDEWVDLLDRSDVCVGPVCTYEETFSDPHVKHRKLVIEVQHPKLGKVKLLNTPYRFSDTPAEVRTPPPAYAEHTEELLHTLAGCTDEDIEQLRRDEAIE
jgi:crotonobetainyl-CoA:carnitine CoA-transferase CaiB-like acyl-CoA transferase